MRVHGIYFKAHVKFELYFQDFLYISFMHKLSIGHLMLLDNQLDSECVPYQYSLFAQRFVC